VNEIRPYEQLIAAKLEQVAVPDMSDSIWAGIEEQLDAPPGGRGAGDGGSGFRVPGWWGIVAVAVVVGLLLWYFGRKGTVAPPPPRALPTQQAPALDREDSVEPAESGRSVGPGRVETGGSRNKPVGSIPAVQTDSLLFHRVPVDSVRVDSLVRQAAPPAKVDSPALQRNRPMLPDVDLYSTPVVPSPGVRKHKGVKGISDDDYKLSAGKDSARKRN